ncbi:nuclear pore complex protein-like protein Nup107 [Lindgomyces ingoldianus]|uniref:Nuclear pore complex protein-like protein Nup107 n=1 Tax=Lindgomyces ingoldianus TaxID=673940 RepID=A0ACB6R5Z4_9PLEO|nr:nuclear pore complex protein-like protein Nup107 [Lindgomyces ingoldianus]KAF2473871.1 nuclear pore complex protein-like protein Nup107 [Lindgomyces ingoldianus]
MASPSRRPQPPAFQLPVAGPGVTLGLSSNDDPLQPLRTMADRVGKEVEKFAERVDHWHTHGNEDDQAKYQTTLRMVGKFKDLAESTVKELKRQNDAENKGELAKSMRRRIKNMAELPHPDHEGDLGDSFQSVVPSIESNSAPSSSKVQELRQWQAELATWELLRIIIEHYYHEPGLDVAAAKRKQLAEVGGGSRYSPNIETWNRFLLEDDIAKEKDIILRWLEQTAQSSETDIQSMTEQLEEQSGKDTDSWNVGWLDTRAKIKQEKRLQGVDHPLRPDAVGLRTFERTEPLITQLDPDAPTRQKRRLEKSDDYYERALWMACYEMLRRGTPWEQICEWCKDKNEAWRGVSMGAAYETHPNGGPNIAGPNLGYLYRRMCCYAARGARSQYECALYGLLGGDLKTVEPVCRTWDDHLYAHYNALLLTRFDSYLQKDHSVRQVPRKLTDQFRFKDAVANTGSWEDSAATIIALLKQQKSTAAQSQSPMKLIQGSLIGGSVDDLVYKVGVAISFMLREDSRSGNLIVDPESDPSNPKPKASNEQPKIAAEKCYQNLATDPYALRILVHVLIVLRKGLNVLNVPGFDRWIAVDNVIALYIEFLRLTKRTDLIPLYAAQLHGDRQVHCLARVLADIKSPQDQMRCIALMEQYRINPVDVISRNCQHELEKSGLTNEGNFVSKYEVMERVNDNEYLWPGQRVKRELPGVHLTAKENSLIESLKWYIHLEKEKTCTFIDLTNALKYFLLNGRMGAANKLVSMMSIESLSLIKTEALCGYAFDFTLPGSEKVDQAEISKAIRKLAAASAGRPRPAELPFPGSHGHRKHVMQLRQRSQTYFELQSVVGFVGLLLEWREEEDKLIKAKREGAKVSTKRAKDLFENLVVVLGQLFESFLSQSSDGQTLTKYALASLSDTNPSKPRLEREATEHWRLTLTYIPEVILSYLSVVQAASFFLSRDLSVKAMEVANMVADVANQWVQDAFMETKRMTQLVDMLAVVSKAMLELSEMEEKKSRGSGKKRGSRGATLRIWDVNVRN